MQRYVLFEKYLHGKTKTKSKKDQWQTVLTTHIAEDLFPIN